MVSYKTILKSTFIKKPIRLLASGFSTFRKKPKANFPFKLKMECSSICNLRCKMCPLHVGLTRKQGYLEFKKFKYIFDQIKPAYLNLTGIGEPFLNKDLFEIIKYAKKKNAMVKLDSNGMLLNKENIKKILDTKIDIISVSIDGVDKESYEKIRVGSNFEQVKNNVKNLVDERNRIKSDTRVHMFFVLQETNIEKLPDFIRLAEWLGVNYVAGSFVVTLGKNSNINNKILKKRRIILEKIRETEELCKKSKMQISITPLLEYLKGEKYSDSYNNNKPCYMPWYSTFITWDGYVNPCDFSCDNEIVFGNVFKEPFKKIWNNEKYKNFRLNVNRDRTKIKLCNGCGVDESYIEKEFKRLKKIPLVGALEYK